MASLGLVGRLPSPLQRAIVRAADGLRHFLEQRAMNELPDVNHLARLPSRDGRRFTGKRVAVAGLFGVRCGLQRGAELMVLDLQARGIDVFAFDLTAVLKEPPNRETSATADIRALVAWAPTDIVIHINPPPFARVITWLPPKLRASTVLVGYWAWELNVTSAAWRKCAAAADEIWCPSPFTADVLKRELPAYPGLISVVPHAVDRDPMTPLPVQERSALRRRFGVPDDCFVVGCSFSFNSNYARKNPGGAVDAFRLAFGLGDPVRLIIRCNDRLGHDRLFAHLCSLANDDPRMSILDSAAAPIGIRDFYGLLDVYISLHRSEGYGLNLVEAAQAGLTVITTGMGLAPDIAARLAVRSIGFRLVVPLDPQGTYDSYPGALWAEPDFADAADALQAAKKEWWTSAQLPTNPASP